MLRAVYGTEYAVEAYWRCREAEFVCGHPVARMHVACAAPDIEKRWVGSFELCMETESPVLETARAGEIDVAGEDRTIECDQPYPIQWGHQNLVAGIGLFRIYCWAPGRGFR